MGVFDEGLKAALAKLSQRPVERFRHRGYKAPAYASVEGEYYPALPVPLPVHAGGVPVAPTLAAAGVCVCVLCAYTPPGGLM